MDVRHRQRHAYPAYVAHTAVAAHARKVKEAGPQEEEGSAGFPSSAALRRKSAPHQRPAAFG